MYDVIVVGGAGAGLTAAIFTARLGLKTLVVTKDIGGRALINSPYAARSIENYPGFESISGVELMRKIEKQAREFGAEIVTGEVIKVGEVDGGFYAETAGQRYEARTLILAFGETPRRLGVKDEEKYEGKGLSYCTHCDAPDYEGKVVAVVGYGARLLDSVTLLSKIASRVYMINWWQEIRELKFVQWLRNRDNIEVLSGYTVTEIHGSDKVEEIVVAGFFGEDRRELKVDGVFVELGTTAKTEFLRGFVDLDEDGKIKVNRDCCTSRPGVFAAGDVTDSLYRQLIISAGDGARAALSAYNYLKSKERGTILTSDIISVKKEVGRV